MTTVSAAESFRCTECGHGSGKWMGFCTQCRSHGTVEAVERGRGAIEPVPLARAAMDRPDRVPTSVGEFDRTLGGGLVPGSAVLVGGEPGVGKSTLLLQVAAGVAQHVGSVLIVSAEESPEQVAGRAERLGLSSDAVSLLATDDLDDIESVWSSRAPVLVVVDSIQAVRAPGVDGTAGSQSQVRECGARLVAMAKRSGAPVILIGHVTKEGVLAGPRVLEHLVDAVLYLEGDGRGGVRFIRGMKNRFGPTPALGIFEMGEKGLIGLPDPTRALAPMRRQASPGVVLFPGVDGRRPILVEIQALVSPTRAVPPRRSVKGIEASRLHQILAVLERRGGLSVASSEVYVAAVGGVRLREPAADLAVALAIASAATDTPLTAVAAWGEVGLTGDVRAVGSDAVRRTEAARVGVDRVIAPAADGLDLGTALREAGITGPVARRRIG